MRHAILAASILAACCTAALAQGTSVPPGLITTCESCHGPGGNGATPSTPRLNGQLSPYIVNRLQELADLTRNSIHAVADYFSHQAPTPARPQTGKLAAIGKQLYVSGDSATGIQACQSCHGANAEGQGNVPRLAGQHRDYLKIQLWDFNFATREHTVMNGNAMKLSSDQIDGLVAYLGAD